MPRPQKSGLDYFPHDVNSSSDEKIELLEIKYPGGKGYAWFFKTLERIYRNGGQLDISSAETVQILGRNIFDSVEAAHEIIKYAIEIGVFDREMYEKCSVLTSESIKRRMQPILFKRENMAKYRQNRVSATLTRHDVAETQHGGVVSGAETHSKEKESKEKNIYTLEIEKIYAIYPNTDPNNDNRPTGKSKKCKDKIRAIIARGDNYPLEKAITIYLANCVRRKGFIKNFETFLNQLPDIDTLNDIKKSPQKAEAYRCPL